MPQFKITKNKTKKKNTLATDKPRANRDTQLPSSDFLIYQNEICSSWFYARYYDISKNWLYGPHQVWILRANPAWPFVPQETHQTKTHGFTKVWMWKVQAHIQYALQSQSACADTTSRAIQFAASTDKSSKYYGTTRQSEAATKDKTLAQHATTNTSTVKSTSIKHQPIHNSSPTWSPTTYTIHHYSSTKFDIWGLTATSSTIHTICSRHQRSSSSKWNTSNVPSSTIHASNTTLWGPRFTFPSPILFNRAHPASKSNTRSTHASHDQKPTADRRDA